VVARVFGNLCESVNRDFKRAKANMHIPGIRASITTMPVGSAADIKTKLTVPSSAPALTSAILGTLPTVVASSRSFTKAFRPMLRSDAEQSCRQVGCEST
jgi:hypothetical protein